MIPDLVPAVGDAPRRLRETLDLTPDHEESCMQSVGGEHVEHALGVLGRPVVERQSY